MTLQELIEKAKELAKNLNAKETPITFMGEEIDIMFTASYFNDRRTVEARSACTSDAKKQRNIVLHPITPMGSDGTQGYKVMGVEGMKVREFLIYICEKYKSDQGDVHIKIPEEGKKFDTCVRCSYRGGNIDVASIVDENFSQAMDLPIDSMTASGGWGRMDYNIKCKTKK